MTARILIATDLDRTLVYSAAAAGSPDGRPADDAVVVERLDGRPISFMSAVAVRLLTDLAARTVVVPVTTRTVEQLARVRLPGRAPRYAVAANGGVLLVDGVPDAGWAAEVRTAVAAAAPLDAALAELSAVCEPGWAGSPRSASNLFCYVVVDRAGMPGGVLDRLGAWAAAAGWTVSLQGRKLYLVPVPLTKSAAVAEVALRTGAELTLAAGDSLLDIDLLANADRGVHPGHGEIAESGWSSPTVDALAETGLRAGEEILRWFAWNLEERLAVGGSSGSARVRIVQLSPAALHALAAGDLESAEAAAGLSLGSYVAGPDWRGLWRRRSAQVAADPGSAAWITGIVWDVERQVAVGRAGFHGPPDGAGMVEVGYAVEPAHRRQGYARAALVALLERAAREPGVRTVRATVSPDNAASRALILQYGFVEVGEQWDDEDGLEFVYEVAANRAR